MRLFRFLLSTVAVSALGCSASMLGLPTQKVVAYNAQTLEVEGPQPVVFRAMREFVVARELRIIYEDANLGRLEAVSATESGYGMTTRERWVFQFEPGTLTLEAQTEQRDQGGIWHSPDRVNSRYSYARERMALAAIEDTLIHVEIRMLSER